VPTYPSSGPSSNTRAAWFVGSSSSISTSLITPASSRCSPDASSWSERRRRGNRWECTIPTPPGFPPIFPLVDLGRSFGTGLTLQSVRPGTSREGSLESRYVETRYVENVSTHWGVVLGDIASAGAAGGTVWAVRVALKSSQEAKKERLRREHREQAERISAWHSGTRRVDPQSLADRSANHTEITLLNSSLEPVYDVVVFLVFIQGSGPRRGEDWMKIDQGITRYCQVFGTLPPGSWTTTVPEGWAVMAGRVSAEVAFTDRRGADWVRRSNGSIEELTKSAIEHYGITRPVNYVLPERA
jgi:hypothetical protein